MHPLSSARRSVAAIALAAAGLLPVARPALAHDGHDHGEEASAPAGAAQPRFAAVSELFELVGVLDGPRLTLYLDRSADNSPVAGAQIELDVAGTPHQATPRDGDTYEVVLAAAPAAGVLPITATVTAGAEVDLLAGELDVHDEDHADDAVVPPVAGWRGLAVAGGAALLAMALLALVGRRLTARRPGRPGGAA